MAFFNAISSQSSSHAQQTDTNRRLGRDPMGHGAVLAHASSWWTPIPPRLFRLSTEESQDQPAVAYARQEGWAVPARRAITRRIRLFRS